MSNKLRQLVNRLGTLLLAFLLAVAVWVAANLQMNPFDDRELTNIPITLLNQPEDTVLVNEDEVSDQVSVQVRAPQSVLSEIRPSSFVAAMDLSGVEPGTPMPVTVVVTGATQQVRLLGIDPEQQTIHLEYVRAMTAPINIQLEGEVATGYQAFRPVISPDEVTIVGPSPYLAEVISVTGLIDVSAANEDISQKVSVFPLDSTGNALSDVMWDPRQIDVTIEVRRKLGFKPDVEVVPDIRGDPAPGYRRGSVLVEPSTVTLRGQSSVLNELPGFIMTTPISITDATAEITQQSPLTLPANVGIVETNYVTVTIEVLPILSSRTMTDIVEIQGVRSGWTATPSPNVVQVVLEGPDAVLNELTPDDLQILLNLFNYPMGVHRVEPDVLAPENVGVVSVIPETIEVVIVMAPTPTPTLTNTATVTPTEATEP
jgi:YbbR domain-containing protein